MLTHTLALASTKGNPVEGGILTFMIIGIIILVVFNKPRNAVRRMTKRTVGRNPKSKVMQTLVGTRKK